MNCKCVLQLTTQQEQPEVLPGWVYMQTSECPDCQRIRFAPIPAEFDREKMMAAYVNALAHTASSLSARTTRVQNTVLKRASAARCSAG